MIVKTIATQINGQEYKANIIYLPPEESGYGWVVQYFRDGFFTHGTRISHTDEDMLAACESVANDEFAAIQNYQARFEA